MLYDSMFLELDRAALRYKVTQPNVRYDFFLRPYAAKQKTKIEGLDKNARGDSYGLLGGGHYFLSEGLLALYGSVEKNKSDSNDAALNFKYNTLTFGLKYSNLPDLNAVYYGLTARACPLHRSPPQRAFF